MNFEKEECACGNIVDSFDELCENCKIVEITEEKMKYNASDWLTKNGFSVTAENVELVYEFIFPFACLIFKRSFNEELDTPYKEALIRLAARPNLNETLCEIIRKEGN